MKIYYEILKLPSNATDYEIYRAFSNLIIYTENGINLDELIRNNSIDAFIVLSDINLRRKYDLSLGIKYEEEVPWYQYTYFENGWNFFDIKGNLFGNEELTKIIKNIKGSAIRTISKDSYFNESKLLADLVEYTKKSIDRKNYISLLSTRKNSINLSDEEKFEYFKIIYDSYKKGFSFSEEFASLIASKNYNSLDIEMATQISAQQLLISKKGVCTHFASLIHEELKGLGLESYFLRMSLPKWYHHVVLYRVNQEWYISDLTNEYLFGSAGYKNKDNNYMNIPLQDFIRDNPYALGTCVVPKLAGDGLLDNGTITLKEFLENRLDFNEDFKESRF